MAISKPTTDHGDDRFLVEADDTETPFALVGEWVLLAPISDRDVRVYGLLRAHVNVGRGDDQAWPSQKKLAAVLGLSKPDPIGASIGALENIGAVRRTTRCGRHGRYTVYTVRLHAPAGFLGLRSTADLHRPGAMERLVAERVRRRPDRAPTRVGDCPERVPPVLGVSPGLGGGVTPVLGGELYKEELDELKILAPPLETGPSPRVRAHPREGANDQSPQDDGAVITVPPLVVQTGTEEQPDELVELAAPYKAIKAQRRLDEEEQPPARPAADVARSTRSHRRDIRSIGALNRTARTVGAERLVKIHQDASGPLLRSVFVALTTQVTDLLADQVSEPVILAALTRLRESKVPHPKTLPMHVQWVLDNGGAGSVSALPVKAFGSVEQFRLNAAGLEASRVLGVAYLPAPQPPSDPTPPKQWVTEQAVAWIDAHENELRAALTERRAG